MWFFFLTVLPLEDKSGPSSRIRIHELAATDSQSLSPLGQSKEMEKIKNLCPFISVG